MALTGGALWAAGRLPAEEPSAPTTPGPETAVTESTAPDDTVYELRTYTTAEGRLPALHARFRDHTMALFEKHGMTNVMYWTPTDGEAAGNTLIYVLKHASRQAADASWRGFRAPRLAGRQGRIGGRRPHRDRRQSVFMTTTEYSPQ